VIPPVAGTCMRRGMFSIIVQKENPEIKNLKNFFRLYEKTGILLEKLIKPGLRYNNTMPE
jgi:hypothetical protein